MIMAVIGDDGSKATNKNRIDEKLKFL